MPPEQGAPSDQKQINWEDYVRDARDLHMAVASAIPAATSAWTTAWAQWLACAAKTHEQMAGGWAGLVRNPSRGGAVLDKMREDFKQYLLETAAIPERAVLEFLEKVSEGARGSERTAPPADEPLDRAIHDVIAAATDVMRDIETAGEYASPRAGRSQAAADALANLHRRIEALEQLRRSRGRGAGRAGA